MAFHIAAEARVELTAASSQPLVQLQRDPDPTLVAQGAFPDDCDSPAGFEQIVSVALVPCYVDVKLGLPEILASCRCRRVGTASMSVPETAVNEAHRPEPTKHQIGSAGEFPIVQAVSEAPCVESPAKGKFGLRIPASDPRHHARTSCPVDYVRHRWSCTGWEEYIRQRISREVSATIMPDGSADDPLGQVQSVDPQRHHPCGVDASCLRRRWVLRETASPANTSFRFLAIDGNSGFCSIALFGCGP